MRTSRSIVALAAAVIIALGGLAGTATAAITVVHQYDIGDGLDAGVGGGPAPLLKDNVGATDLALSGTLPTFSASIAPSAFNSVGSMLAVDLTNANDNGYFAANLLSGVTSNYGVDLWVKTNAASQTRNIFFPNGWEFGSGVGKGGLGIQQSGTSYQVIAPGIFNLGGIPAVPGQWTHLAAVLVGTNQIRMYANGELIRTQFSTPNHAGGAAHLGINAGGGANSGFDGLLDHARVFTFAAGQFRQADLSLDTLNLAEGGTASQSSTWSGSLAASNAIDNIVAQGDNTTHTAAGDANPWWRVVMPTDGRIERVVLNNRPGCCQERLRDIFVDVLNAGGDVVWTSPEQNDGNWMGSPAKITVDVPDYVRGNTVRVRRIPYDGSTAGRVLALGEVQTFGIPLTNVALGRPATQSSEYPGFPAGNGTDGSFGNFTHTNSGELNPWWMVSLGAGAFNSGYDIESIVLHNRGDGCCQDRLRDITVAILDSQQNAIFTSAVLNPGNVLVNPSFMEVDLLALLGQEVHGGFFVRISRAGLAGNSVLSLGEVQVFGVDAIPEPATLSLLALGGLGLLRRRRRRA